MSKKVLTLVVLVLALCAACGIVGAQEPNPDPPTACGTIHVLFDGDVSLPPDVGGETPEFIEPLQRALLRGAGGAVAGGITVIVEERIPCPCGFGTLLGIPAGAPASVDYVHPSVLDDAAGMGELLVLDAVDTASHTVHANAVQVVACVP